MITTSLKASSADVVLDINDYGKSSGRYQISQVSIVLMDNNIEEKNKIINQIYLKYN